MSEPFWNLTGGYRPAEPYPGCFAGICEDLGHRYDSHYGPRECARCGHKTTTVSIRRKQFQRWRLGRRLSRLSQGGEQHG